MENSKRLKDALLAEIRTAADLDALERLRVSALGRKGSVTNLMKSLGNLAPEHRRTTGQTLNQVKEAILLAIEIRKADLEDLALNVRLARETVDVTLPVLYDDQGRLHPISQTLDEVIANGFVEIQDFSPDKRNDNPDNIHSDNCP